MRAHGRRLKAVFAFSQTVFRRKGGVLFNFLLGKKTFAALPVGTISIGDNRSARRLLSINFGVKSRNGEAKVLAEREEKKRKRGLLFSAETAGMFLALFSIMGLLCLITGDSVFFTVGGAVRKFLLGTIGFAAYPVLVFFLYIGIKAVIGFKTRVRGVKLGIIMFFVYLLLAGLIVQTATTRGEIGKPYGEYLSYCYYHEGSFSHTAGGLLFALAAHPLCSLLTEAGAYVFYALNLIVITVLVFRKRFKNFLAEEAERREKRADERAERELEKKTKEFENARKKAAARGVSGSVEYVKADGRNRAKYGERYDAANESAYYRAEQTSMSDADTSAGDYVGSARKNGETEGFKSGEGYPRGLDGLDSYHGGGLDGIYGNEKFNLKSKRDFQKNDDRARSLKLLFGDADSYTAGRSSKAAATYDGYGADSYGDSSEGARDEYSRGYDGYARRAADADEVRPSKSYQSDYDDDMEAKLDYIRRPVKPDYREAAKSPMGNDVPDSVAIRNAGMFDDVDQSMPDRDVYVINDGKTSSKSAGGIRSFDLRSGRETSGAFGSTDRLGGISDDFSRDLNRGYNFSEGGDLSVGFERGGDSDENGRMRGDFSSRGETRDSVDFSFDELLKNQDSAEQTVSDERASISGLKRIRENAENSAAERAAGSFGDGERTNGADSRGIAMTELSENGGSVGSEKPFGQRLTPVRGEQTTMAGDLSDRNADGQAAKTDAAPARSGLNISEERKLVNPIDAIPANYRYRFAPYNLMNDYRPNAAAIADTRREQESRKSIILQVLTNAKISAQIVDVKYGPALTRFELTIPDDVSVKRVTELQKDFNFRIAAYGTIRIVAPIPGTSRIGIEVPNSAPATVGLKELVMDQGFKNAKKSSLTFCLGRDLVGAPVNLDLSKMPHLLVAGATGTGKSVFLNTLLISLMYKYTPEELRIILVDPKIVEFSLFKGTPNLLFDEIITETPKACAMLDWACKEMDDRYRLLNENLVKNVDEYNAFMASKGGKPLYKILIIIDEFADLMATSNDKKNIENKISRIAAKARAAGIHLIMATQRPSVDIMEGSIKTNFTSRVAFKMSSPTDAQVIMGENGAEKLLGRGDVLYRTSSMMTTERAQGAFIDTPEIDAICRYLKEHNKCYYNEFALDEINKNIEKEDAAAANATDVLGGESGADGNNKSDEEIVKNAMRLAISTNNISISMMQRRLGLGYPRAGKIMDILVDRKYVSDSLNSRNREINMTKEEFETVFGEPFDLSQKQ